MNKFTEYQKVYKKRHPWYVPYFSAKNRCYNPHNKRYHRYGRRGIKMLTTLKDFKYLWFRDKAYLLKCPSIDRKDKNGHYEIDNCRFIEFDENRSRDSGNPILCRNAKGKILHHFKNCAEAARFIGRNKKFDKDNILRAVKRKKEGSPGMSIGYYWEYENCNIQAKGKEREDGKESNRT